LCLLIGSSLYLFKKNKFNLTWLLLSLVILITWMFLSGKISSNISPHYGRLAVWRSSMEMSFKHPFVGWGIGTYKGIFPALGGIHSIPWKTAHNDWIQLIFESGYIMSITIMSYIIYLAIGLYRLRAYAYFAGIVLVFSNMMVHFPSRMIQCVLIIIYILAQSQEVINRGINECRNS